MCSTLALISCNAALRGRRQGGRGRKKTRRERISHKVGSMHGRRREGEGADLELKLIRLSLKVPWVPWINHHIKLHCPVGAAGAEVLPSFMTPPTHTHTRPLHNFIHIAMKSMHTRTQTHTTSIRILTFTMPSTSWQ